MATVDELRATARRARHDADALRAVAAGLDLSVVHDLPRLAGDRTWVGPAAARVEQTLRAAGHELAVVAGDLRRQASRLDQEASDLERAAARAQFAPVS